MTALCGPVIFHYLFLKIMIDNENIYIQTDISTFPYSQQIDNKSKENTKFK